MTTIVHCIDELRSLLGDELLLRELKGILRKHKSLHGRTRSAGRVEMCLNKVLGIVSSRGAVSAAQIARIASAHSLSQASVYRLCHQLRIRGVHCRAVQLLQDMNRFTCGVY